MNQKELQIAQTGHSHDSSSQDNSSDNPIINIINIINESFTIPSRTNKDSQKKIQTKASEDKEPDATS